MIIIDPMTDLKEHSEKQFVDMLTYTRAYRPQNLQIWIIVGVESEMGVQHTQ